MNLRALVLGVAVGLASCAVTFETNNRVYLHQQILMEAPAVQPLPASLPVIPKGSSCKPFVLPEERPIPVPVGLLNPLLTSRADTEAVLVAYVQELQAFIKEERQRLVEAQAAHLKSCKS